MPQGNSEGSDDGRQHTQPFGAIHHTPSRTTPLSFMMVEHMGVRRAVLDDGLRWHPSYYITGTVAALDTLCSHSSSNIFVRIPIYLWEFVSCSLGVYIYVFDMMVFFLNACIHFKIVCLD